MLLAQLAEEIRNRATPSTPSVFLQGDQRVRPADETIPRPEAREEFLLTVEHELVGGFSHRQK